MLAQNFMSAKDLGLDEAQKEALVTVLGMMERGEIKHKESIKINYLSGQVFSGQFNMRHWNITDECGTVCCIGGTAELVGDVKLLETVASNDRLYNLCFGVPDMEAVTVEQAARALRNYLTTGRPKWKKILKAG